MEGDQGLRVRMGRLVELELIDRDGQCEALQARLVPDAAADFGHALLGENTPLGRAIFDQPAGALVLYEVGDLRAVRILAVWEADSELSDVEAQKRRAAAVEAAAQAARRNAETFASSYTGKWGDYDPDAAK